MKEFALTAYGFLCVMLPALLLYGILHRLYRAKGIAEPRNRFVMTLVLSLYVAGVFYFTGSGTVYDIRQYGLSAMALELNLIPFSAGPIDAVGYLLNVVLFVPLGFLLPLLWPKEDRFWKILLAGVAFSLLIELSQLINLRSTDIDDCCSIRLARSSGSRCVAGMPRSRSGASSRRQAFARSRCCILR